ncbi:MAG: hypothetical protein V1704_03220 [Candidatus Vogelbacteria bacterium]
MIERVLYAITTEDVRKVAQEEHIPVTKKDLPFIEDKIGDYFRERWQEAIAYALNELMKK